MVGHTDSIADQDRPVPVELPAVGGAGKAVAELLKPGVSQPDRFQIDGKGSEAPIATNATPEGRAKNRRVEILIPRVE